MNKKQDAAQHTPGPLSDRERELLVALQEAQHYLHFHEAADSLHMQRIAAAIAKAEGSAS